ncbi:MAG: SCO family protein [Pseudomonadota bacterium]
MSERVQRLVLFGAAGVVAVILGLSLSLLIFGPTENQRSGAVTAIGQAQIGGPFELIDQNGQTVTQAALEGQLNLIYFGFTFCPDFCPTELANMAVAKEKLAERGVDTQLFFITIDPERDTPEILKEYAEAFDPEMIALGGSVEQVAAAANAYRVIYRRAEDPDFPDGYAMDHSTFVYAVDGSGRFITVFTAATDPEEIAETLEP